MLWNILECLAHVVLNIETLFIPPCIQCKAGSYIVLAICISATERCSSHFRIWLTQWISNHQGGVFPCQLKWIECKRCCKLVVAGELSTWGLLSGNREIVCQYNAAVIDVIVTEYLSKILCFNYLPSTKRSDSKLLMLFHSCHILVKSILFPNNHKPLGKVLSFAKIGNPMV